MRNAIITGIRLSVEYVLYLYVSYYMTLDDTKATGRLELFKFQTLDFLWNKTKIQNEN